MVLTEDLFTAKIRDSEGDDLLLAQGILADWMEEQGNPLSEVLRMGIEIRKNFEKSLQHDIPKDGSPGMKMVILMHRLFNHKYKESVHWAKMVKLPQTFSDYNPDRKWWWKERHEQQ